MGFRRWPSLGLSRVFPLSDPHRGLWNFPAGDLKISIGVSGASSFRPPGYWLRIGHRLSNIPTSRSYRPLLGESKSVKKNLVGVGGVRTVENHGQNRKVTISQITGLLHPSMHWIKSSCSTRIPNTIHPPGPMEMAERTRRRLVAHVSEFIRKQRQTGRMSLSWLYDFKFIE